jgi:hypothetical protein
MVPALALACVSVTCGGWWLLADLILDRVPLPCRRPAAR